MPVSIHESGKAVQSESFKALENIRLINDQKCSEEEKTNSIAGALLPLKFSGNKEKIEFFVSLAALSKDLSSKITDVLSSVFSSVNDDPWKMEPETFRRNVTQHIALKNIELINGKENPISEEQKIAFMEDFLKSVRFNDEREAVVFFTNLTFVLSNFDELPQGIVKTFNQAKDESKKIQLKDISSDYVNVEAFQRKITQRSVLESIDLINQYKSLSKEDKTVLIKRFLESVRFNNEGEMVFFLEKLRVILKDFPKEILDVLSSIFSRNNNS